MLAFAIAYVGFFILCAVSFAYAKPPAEPVPALLVGIPVGVVALIVVIFRVVHKNAS